MVVPILLVVLGTIRADVRLAPASAPRHPSPGSTCARVPPLIDVGVSKHVHFFQQDQSTAVKALRARFRDLFSRVEIPKRSRPNSESGLQFLIAVRALVEIGTNDAAPGFSNDKSVRSQRQSHRTGLVSGRLPRLCAIESYRSRCPAAPYVPRKQPAASGTSDVPNWFPCPRLGDRHNPEASSGSAGSRSPVALEGFGAVGYATTSTPMRKSVNWSIASPSLAPTSPTRS